MENSNYEYGSTCSATCQNGFELQAELNCDEEYSVWTNPENSNGEFARTINGEWKNEAELIHGSYKDDWICNSNTNEYRMLYIKL